MMQQDSTPVDRLYSDFTRVLERIDAAEISLRNSVEEIFRKNLILAAASYFEHRVTNDLLDFVRDISISNELLTEFVRNQAIERRYHTLFVWNAHNANKFFGLFGTNFKGYMDDYMQNNPNYENAIRAFMEIGRERNKIVHDDFGSVIIEKTTADIYNLYKEALIFVEQIPLHFEAFLASRQSPDSE